MKFTYNIKSGFLPLIQVDFRLIVALMIICGVVSRVLVAGTTDKITGQDVQHTRNSVESLVHDAMWHDSVYQPNSEASQPKALKLYEAALEANPSDSERLFVLSRMAALTSYCYDTKKGEKPDFRKSISYNKQIVEYYPPTEPQVYEALISMSCGHIALKEYYKAIECSKKAFEFNVATLEKRFGEEKSKRDELAYRLGEIRDRQQAGELAGSMRKYRNDARRTKKAIDKVERCQIVSVDKIYQAAMMIAPSLAEAEMRNLKKNFAGSHIARQADDCLARIIDKQPDLWLPSNTQGMPDESAIASSNITPSANIEGSQNAIVTNSFSVTNKSETQAERVTNDKVVINETYLPKQSRASPKVIFYFVMIFAVAVIVVVSALKYSKNNKQENLNV